MRLFIAASLVVAIALPGSIATAQTPPVVVIGPPPASSGPPPQAQPTVPPGYEIEGDLGGVHFRARVTTPQAQPPAPPVVAPPPMVVAPQPPPPPVMVQQPQPQPTYVLQQPTYAQPQAYAQPQPYPEESYPLQAQPRQDRGPRLDSGMDFGARLAFEVLGAGVGFGLATGLGYLVNDNTRNSEFEITTLLASAGLVPTGVAVFGGAIAGGRGRFGGAMLGEIIGGGLGALVLVVGDLNLREGWEQIAIIAGPAILGAILGFEAQHGIRTARLEQRLEREQVQLSGVSIAPLAQGNGAMAGISGTF